MNIVKKGAYRYEKEHLYLNNKIPPEKDSDGIRICVKI